MRILLTLTSTLLLAIALYAQTPEEGLDLGVDGHLYGITGHIAASHHIY